MWPLVAAMAAGGLLGAAKHQSEAGNRAQRARDFAKSEKYDRAVALFSPWTRLQMKNAQRPQEETMFGNVLGGMMAGAGMGQQINAAVAANDLNEAKTKYYHNLKTPPTIMVDPYGTPYGPNTAIS